jgi:hypothetical protein
MLGFGIRGVKLQAMLPDLIIKFPAICKIFIGLLLLPNTIIIYIQILKIFDINLLF